MSAVAALAVGLLALLGPGWLLARAAGLRGVLAASAATGLSCAVVGVAEVLASAAGLGWGRWGWPLVGALTAAAALVLLAARRLAAHGRQCPAPDGAPAAQAPATAGRWRRGSAPEPDRLVLLGALLLAVVLGGAGLWWGTGPLTTPAQAFDAVFHLAAVQTIREGGDASSLGGLADLYQGSRVYYPTVLHGIAALMPGTPALVCNALVLLVGAVAWPLGIMGLVDAVVCAPRRTEDPAAPTVGQAAPAGRGSWSEDERARALTLAGSALAAAATSAVAVTLTTLAVWPYALSLVCLPGVLALAHVLTRVRGWRAGLVTALLAAATAAGAVLAHGGAVFNLLVLLAPLGATVLTRALRTGGLARRRLLVLLTLALVGAGAGAWVMRASLASVLGYEREGGSAAATLAQALMDTPQYGPLTWHGVPVGIGLLALAVPALRRGGRELRPHLATWLLTLALVVLTGGPQWPGRALGALWYLQKARVQPLVVMAVLVLSGYGLHLLARRCCAPRSPRARLRGAALVGATAALALAAVPLHARLAASVHDEERIAYGTLVTASELAAQAELAALLPPGAVVVAAPSQGGTYLWAEHGVHLVYPTRVAPADATVHWRLTQVEAPAGARDATCRLLDELGARYYLDVERRDEEAAPAGRWAPPRWDAGVAGWSTQGMELLGSAPTTTGSLSLYRIVACD